MKQYIIYSLSEPNSDEIRYVGVTSSTIKRRLYQHVYDGKNKKGNYRLNWIKSILNKGLVPEIREIEVCTEDTWADREIYWISYYSTVGRITNTAPGGLGSPKSKVNLNEDKKKEVHKYSLDGKYLESYESISIAANIVGTKASGIWTAIDVENKSAKGFQWRSTKSDKVQPFSRRYWGHSIKVYKMVPVLYKEYETMREASNELGISYNKINSSIESSKTVDGYLFEK